MGILEKFKLPIGWSQETKAGSLGKGFWQPLVSTLNDVGLEFLEAFPRSVFGWLITGLAISFGAPFWFDLLNKLMVIRSTVKPHEKSPEESSEDRQRQESAVKKWQVGTPAAPAPATVVASPPTGFAFRPHEWATGEDPQEGKL